MIERPTIIITSLGRTGTTFFSHLFREIIPNCASFHEPDIVQYFGAENRIKAFLERVKDAGIYNMVLLKLMGKWTLINVSDSRLRKELSKEGAVKELLQQRKKFIESKHGTVYVESNAGYYGLLDILPDVFSEHKAVFIIRDGREWVSSAMKVEELYGKKGLRKILSHKMPSALEFPDDPLHETWMSVTRFKKLCWAWSKLNEYALKTASMNPNARVFQFEKIFVSQDKYQHLNDLVQHSIDLPNIDPLKVRETTGWLERKINQSSNEFGWETWSTDQRHQFEHLCGPLMEKMGYTF